MDEEIKEIEKNQTWDLVNILEDKTPIGFKWVYKMKVNEKGIIEKFKARLVSKGLVQQDGIDYGQTFTLVAMLDTLRAILVVETQNKWPMYHMDVNSSFLNAILEEEVYVNQPPGFKIQGQENKVYKLKNAFYGLKQVPRAWYSCINSYLLNKGFNRRKNDPTLYIKSGQQDNILILCIYVYDIIYKGNMSLNEFKEAMKREFELACLGLMKYFLVIEVQQSEQGIFVSRHKYATDILKRFTMKKCKPIDAPIDIGTKQSKKDKRPTIDPFLYKKLVGNLMYLTTTRPDIMYGVSLISRFMQSQKGSHWKIGKMILRYTAGTIDYGIFYSTSYSNSLTSYIDSYFLGSLDNQKSTSGYAFQLGTNLV